MISRIKKLESLFSSHRIDAYLALSDVNVTYLAGFPASESWLLTTSKKTYYLTDSRFVLEVRRQLKGIVLKEYTRSRLQTLFETARASRVKRIGFNPEEISLAAYRQLKRQCPAGIKLVACPPLVETLRTFKDPAEIRCIRRALAIHKEALVMLSRHIRPGVTERQLLWKLEDFARRRKVGFSFSPIIASGPNSCYPHAKVTDRKVRRNEPVLVDIGIDYKGYKSDLTRIFFSGKISHLVQKTYDRVAQAQQKAILAIRPGVTAAHVDTQARDFLKQHKLAKYFGHALGHGVGLEIHESPRVSQQSRTTLEEGMVITVEPAVYLPNQFGIRIEDMVLVTGDGCEVLSSNIK